ncbi:PIN domain-containing protein [Pseudonocardia sp. CA-107938]|uniref:PIN domain-containing protein n=1 Tax=Pseudonocardia sp. CA-107938 TaxID=3240021 RepID=UPI003D901E30
MTTVGTEIGLDTSVAVPLLLKSHPDHAGVVSWLDGRRPPLCGHALAETYSVLTRLPGDARLSATDAVRLMAQLDDPLLLGPGRGGHIPAMLAEAGVSGGAVYDGLVALAAAQHRVTLATRDARARRTYEAVGADVVVVG